MTTTRADLVTEYPFPQEPAGQNTVLSMFLCFAFLFSVAFAQGSMPKVFAKNYTIVSSGDFINGEGSDRALHHHNVRYVVQDEQQRYKMNIPSGVMSRLRTGSENPKPLYGPYMFFTTVADTTHVYEWLLFNQTCVKTKTLVHHVADAYPFQYDQIFATARWSGWTTTDDGAVVDIWENCLMVSKMVQIYTDVFSGEWREIHHFSGRVDYLRMVKYAEGDIDDEFALPKYIDDKCQIG